MNLHGITWSRGDTKFFLRVLKNISQAERSERKKNFYREISYLQAAM